MVSNVLQRNQKQLVEFDPTNSEHRDAFLKLFLTSRQESKFRFFVDLPFTTVVGQVLATLALSSCTEELKKYGLDVKSVLKLLQEKEAFRALEEEDQPDTVATNVSVFPKHPTHFHDRLPL